MNLPKVGDKETVEFAQRLAAATPTVWATPVLLGLNVLVFLIMAASDPGSVANPSLASLVRWGADFGPLTVTDGQWWRLLACCFVHIGMLHLLCNLYALFQAGRLAERLFGNGFFLAIYLGSGLVGSLASLWFHPVMVAAGASGAVFGVYGALLGYLGRAREALPRSVVQSLAKGTLVFIGWNVAYVLQHALNQSINATLESLQQVTQGVQQAQSTGPLVDQAAHAGGLVAGLILGFVAARPLATQPRRALVGQRSILLAVVLGAIAALLLVPVLSSGRRNVAALNTVGSLYLRGEGVTKDPARAVKFFEGAAEQGDLKAQTVLAALYYLGEGVPKNIDEAVKWSVKAAEQGDLNSQRTLADLYSRGQGVATNLAEASKWLGKAAEQGDLACQKQLGAMYLRGEGVARDMAEAVKWFSRAALQGDVQLQKALGQLYSRGEGVPVDLPQAAKWFRLAANQGDAEAQTMAGVMYASGLGVEKDPVEALKWLSLGADTGKAVSAVREALERELTPSQKEEASQRAAKFTQRQSRVKPR